MTAEVFLEPLAPFSPLVKQGTGGIVVSPPIFFGFSGDPSEALQERWSVRLDSSGSLSGPLPQGMSRSSVERGGVRVEGKMDLSQLLLWIEQLQSRGFVHEALALRTTLEGHSNPGKVWSWGEGGRFRLDLTRPAIMGVINLTPDSFSGDGVMKDVAAAVAQGERLVAQGADILDVGGESTRPGAEPVSLAEELERVVPVVGQLSRRLEVPVSVDTSKPEVMEAALEAGAGMINDVSALGVDFGAECYQRGGDHSEDHSGLDSRKLALLAKLDHPIILMHRRGTPGWMQDNPQYGDVVAEVYRFLARRMQLCQEGGIEKSRLLVDVGIGFGKNIGHNHLLLRRLRMFRGLGVPLLLGLSRKRIVGVLSGESHPQDRDLASHVLGVLGMMAGASLLRVHDVRGARQALAVAQGWLRGAEAC